MKYLLDSNTEIMPIVVTIRNFIIVIIHNLTLPIVNYDVVVMLTKIKIIGLYRVNYDDHNWEMIASYLRGSNRERIHKLNRAQVNIHLI